ncbi:MAG: NAD-binding protein, partial [Rhodospirillales bacterium]|nr:NAD-binding protein [Rhodospirillales bacterium]
MAKIGFIGLGNMGGPMAANLVKAGHHVTGFDLVPASLDALKAAGGSVASSAAEAAKGAEVVITMLPAGEHVRQVWLHQGGLIDVVKDAGPLLIDCSTIDVASAREVAAAAETAGLSMLDAPVSGGTTGAQAGTLTFMVGGSEDAFARGQTVLQAMGKNIFHAGGPGAGQAVKICNNMMLAINMVGVAEGFLLAEKQGLDWQKLHAI